MRALQAQTQLHAESGVGCMCLTNAVTTTVMQMIDCIGAEYDTTRGSRFSEALHAGGVEATRRHLHMRAEGRVSSGRGGASKGDQKVFGTCGMCVFWTFTCPYPICACSRMQALQAQYQGVRVPDAERDVHSDDGRNANA